MQHVMIFILATIAAGLLIFLTSRLPINPDRDARSALCQVLAEQVRNGEATLADYLMTRCSAENLADSFELEQSR